MNTLTVAISTIGMRGLRLSNLTLPVTSGVRFLIIQQMPEKALDRAKIRTHLAENLQRNDISIIQSKSHGAANSRNIAIAATETEFLLFADDDMAFCPDAWRDVRMWFEENPTHDFMCGRLRAPDGGWRKSYGNQKRVTRFNCAKVGTPEIALRVGAVRDVKTQFSPDFGAGALYPIGDEYLFLTDCLKAGLTGWHVAICLGVHDRNSSGLVLDPATNAARAEVFHRAFGRWSGLVRVGFAIKHARWFRRPEP